MHITLLNVYCPNNIQERILFTFPSHVFTFIPNKRKEKIMDKQQTEPWWLGVYWSCMGSLIIQKAFIAKKTFVNVNGTDIYFRFRKEKNRKERLKLQILCRMFENFMVQLFSELFWSSFNFNCIQKERFFRKQKVCFLSKNRLCSSLKFWLKNTFFMNLFCKLIFS